MERKRNLLVTAVAILVCLTSCQPDATLWATINTSNTQIAQTNPPQSALTGAAPTGTQTPTATPENSPEPVVPSPTPTPTSSIVEVTPCGDYICETTDKQTDIDILARLCVVEVRGFNEVRDDACVSVVNVVVNRAINYYLSDGTIRGTILWGCTETDCLQFPGYVVNGCEGIQPIACPWSYPDDIEHFRGVIDQYLRGHWGPGFWCSGYMFYDSRPESIVPNTCTADGRVPCLKNNLMADACMIQAANGQFEVFHD